VYLYLYLHFCTGILYLILERCLGSEGHSELLLLRSASLADSRWWRRRAAAAAGRGSAEDDIPAMESSFSSRSSTPDVLEREVRAVKNYEIKPLTRPSPTYVPAQKCTAK
jgi:hypothetical protein